MSDLELIDAVAHVTGEDSCEIRRRGFVLTGPEDSGSNPEPECLLDVMLVDLPESGTLEWDFAESRCRLLFLREGRRMNVPDVVIGGAQRSGTTFLAEILQKHPDVYVPRPLWPEPKVCLREHPRGDEGYREEYARLFTNARVAQLRVEKTANYLESPAAPDRLVRIAPQAKFLFILRDPVMRAWSNWKYSVSTGLETLSFEEAVDREHDRPNPFGDAPGAARPFDYVGRGRYGTFAARWLRAIGPDRVKFILFEEAVRHPEAVVHDVQSWLGVPMLPWTALATERTNASPAAAAPVAPSLARRLRDGYREDMSLLTRLTGLGLHCWDAT